MNDNKPRASLGRKLLAALLMAIVICTVLGVAILVIQIATEWLGFWGIGFIVFVAAMVLSFNIVSQSTQGASK
jgi:uncharacterized membrane protein